MDVREKMSITQKLIETMEYQCDICKRTYKIISEAEECQRKHNFYQIGEFVICHRQHSSYGQGDRCPQIYTTKEKGKIIKKSIENTIDWYLIEMEDDSREWLLHNQLEKASNP